jgi:MEMO1 family protein
MVEYPKLRAVEAFPTEVNGRQVLCLRDPTHVAESTLFVPLAAIEILRHFDGTHSILDIQAAYVRRHGHLLYREDVEELIVTLDQHHFLDTDRFAQHREALNAGFRRASCRPAFLAGKSYPADPEGLRQTLDQLTAHPRGPTAAPGADREPLRALIAPHIDFLRGSLGYAWAYHRLPARTDADLFVILGTAHAGIEKPFAACAKDFDTPLGAVQTVTW